MSCCFLPLYEINHSTEKQSTIPTQIQSHSYQINNMLLVQKVILYLSTYPIIHNSLSNANKSNVYVMKLDIIT